jgi:hypothetical protein
MEANRDTVEFICGNRLSLEGRRKKGVKYPRPCAAIAIQVSGREGHQRIPQMSYLFLVHLHYDRAG